MSDIYKERRFEWFVLRVKSGNEAQVMKMINERCSTDDIIDVFIPNLMRNEEGQSDSAPKEKSKDKKTKRVGILPGYIFVKMDKCSNLISDLRAIPLVYNFLHHNGKPQVVSDEEIQNIKDSIKNSSEFASGNTMKVGTNVEVVSGPFESYIGTVEEMLEEKVMVKIVFCGRDVIVNFAPEQLKAKVDI